MHIRVFRNTRTWRQILETRAHAYCPFSPYSVTPRQGTCWETKVCAGRIVLHLKETTWLVTCPAVFFFRLKSFFKKNVLRVAPHWTASLGQTLDSNTHLHWIFGSQTKKLQQHSTLSDSVLFRATSDSALLCGLSNLWLRWPSNSANPAQHRCHRDRAAAGYLLCVSEVVDTGQIDLEKVVALPLTPLIM